MKKKHIIFLILVIIVIISSFVIKPFLGSKPFKDLSETEISTVSVELLPPGVTYTLSDDEIKELLDILHTVVIYGRDDSYTEYDGQAVIFTITREDGGQTAIQAYNPFLIIDGAGYKTKYEPCQALSSLGNAIRNKK